MLLDTLFAGQQSPCRRRRTSGGLACACVGIAILLFVISALSARAQQEHWPAGSVGKLEGDDISVQGPALSVAVPGATTLFVASGSVVTVHSGAARLTLSANSFVDICGPAKFTLLESGGAYTLALSFGRVRLRLSDSTQVRVYTPFIIASPVAIVNNVRDFTLGLDLNDLMCVYSAQGAGAIEQQFGGENLIVPESGEFFLPGERLPAVTGTPGTCRCTSYQPHAAAPPQPAAPASQSAPPQVEAKAPIPAESPKRDSAAPVSASENAPANEKKFDLPADANRRPPASPSVTNTSSDPPEVEQPVWKVVMPALTFSASQPERPVDRGPQYALAIPDYHVERGWVFTGHVEDTSASSGQQSENAASPAPAASRQKKKGFWGRLKKFFGGPPASASAATSDTEN